MLPQFKHHRVTQIQQQQLQTSKPLLKRIWQKIVQSKIANQIDCLKYCKQQGIEKLTPLGEKVKSGDSGNVEAVAARLYWPSLFSKKFTRNGNGVLNDALNYGYAICRAVVARAVVGAGLNPGFGLHHANSLNPFNLADDLMEPLRPLVDRLVFKLGDELPVGLNSGIKQQLLTVCDERLKISGEVLSLLRASEVMVSSLLRCYEERSAELIALPELVP
jgi:CRISPR-associated protein Cas1